MRRMLSLAGCWLLLGSAAGAGEIDPGVVSMFRQWSMALPSTARVIICHGFSCTFRTEIGLGRGDHARMAELMAPASGSAEAERAAIQKTEVWFEKRIAPETGTANGIIGYSRDRGQFDCIDSTNNTNSLLIVLDQLGLLRQHTIAKPISRLFTGGGPHFTAVIKDRKTSQGWTVDPWTHNHAEPPDVWKVEKWLAGG